MVNETMDEKKLLCDFEEKYPFLYEIQVDGVPLYTCLRDDVFRILQEGKAREVSSIEAQKGRIYTTRIFDSFIKIVTNRGKTSLIFTSSMYRRDHGRNLAAEYLLERYPDAIVFEWPSRNESFDSAYFADPQKARYCPLDGYVLLQKMYGLLRKKKAAQIEREVRERLVRSFQAAQQPMNENEQAAIDAIIEKLPKSCAQTELSHDVFRWIFKGYTNVDTAVDFWGSARENIIPVLPGKVQSVELQHGIITGYHPGYVYPQFVKRLNIPLFKRKILVYGQETKSKLTTESIFDSEQIEIVGNPRIRGYKEEYKIKSEEKHIVLFTSQPYEQDGSGTRYYANVIPYLQSFYQAMMDDAKWKHYSFVIKLHPRENEAIKQVYQASFLKAQICEPADQLYDLFGRTVLHLTVSSTTLYEAAQFGVPTVVIPYAEIDHDQLYGFHVWKIDTGNARAIIKAVDTPEIVNKYITELQDGTLKYM